MPDSGDVHAMPQPKTMLLALAAWLTPGCVIITGDQIREKEDEVEDTSGKGEDAWVQIVTGGNHSCALRKSGLIDCWGLDDDGQTTPRDGEYKFVTGGGFHTCGILRGSEETDPDTYAGTAGTVECWGKTTHGQVDAPDVDFVKVSGGTYHNCGLEPDGNVICWGYNQFGQSDVPPGEQFTDISAGHAHTCGVKKSGQLLCWGQDSCDQSSYPGGGDWVMVSAGEQHTCAMDSTGEIECWGAAQKAGCQLLEQLEVPATDPDDDDDPWVYAKVVAGDFHTCALTTLGELRCWGDHSQGATNLDDDYVYIDIDAGGAHTCGLSANQIIECNGYDAYGQDDPPEWEDETTTTTDSGI